MATTTRKEAPGTRDTTTPQPRSDEAAAKAAPPPAAQEQAAAPLNGSYTWPAPDGRRSLALFCYEAPAGAVGRFVANLAGALAKRQVAVHLFARCRFDLPAEGVMVHVLEGGGDYLPEQIDEFTLRAGSAFVEQFPAGTGPVAALGFEWAAAPALSLVRGERGIDTLLSLHSLERQRSDLTGETARRIDEIERAGLREAQAVLVHGDAAGKAAAACAPECAGRIAHARQPFPVEDFTGVTDAGQVKARYQVGPVDPTILFVGDLAEHYGPDLLVKAMPAVLKNHKQARLIVAGDGGLFWPLRVYARYLLIEHAVRLPGAVQSAAMHELIQAADIVVVPSRHPTPWWPFQAAWAARRPVVATHNAAPGGILDHEINSVLTYPSENSLVWGIERVLFDPELALAIGKKGRAVLEERFGWDAVAAQVEELLGARQAR
jgi:glycosyltransferase involved in cell wall biosynthesis